MVEIIQKLKQYEEHLLNNSIYYVKIAKHRKEKAKVQATFFRAYITLDSNGYGCLVNVIMPFTQSKKTIKYNMSFKNQDELNQLLDKRITEFVYNQNTLGIEEL